MALICDIETSSLPDEQLALLKPEFTAAKNLRDPEKIKASIAEKETAWRESCALDAKYGRILVIGILDTAQDPFAAEGDGFEYLENEEKTMLEDFWAMWLSDFKVVGFCIRSFDLPFICQRSWILGVRVPVDYLEESWRKHSKRIIDLQQIWTGFSNRIDGQSLDSVCRALGIGRKNGKGSDFAKLFVEDRAAALAYLENDLILCSKLAQRLGVV